MLTFFKSFLTFENYSIEILSYKVFDNASSVRMGLKSSAFRVEEHDINRFRDYLASYLPKAVSWASSGFTVTSITSPTLSPSLKMTVFWVPVIFLVMALLATVVIYVSITKRQLWRHKDSLVSIIMVSGCILLSVGDLALQYSVPSRASCVLSQTLTWMALSLSQGYDNKRMEICLMLK
jgi:hypothetical protein